MAAEATPVTGTNEFTLPPDPSGELAKAVNVEIETGRPTRIDRGEMIRRELHEGIILARRVYARNLEYVDEFKAAATDIDAAKRAFERAISQAKDVASEKIRTFPPTQQLGLFSIDEDDELTGGDDEDDGDGE